MSAPERFSLKFFEAVIRAARMLSQEEIERIESGEAQVCLVVDGIKKNARNKLTSDNDIEAIYESVKVLDPEKRKDRYKSERLPNKHIKQLEARIKRSNNLKDIAKFSEQSAKES